MHPFRPWAFTLAAGPLLAQGSPLSLEDEDKAYQNLLELLNTPVVAASKRAQTTAESPAVVTVLRADQIRERGYTSLAQALRAMPGLSLWEDNLISSVSIRGFNSVRGWSQFLKIMVDGQPVPFRSGGSYFLDEEFIPLEAVERIEVIRGPASALYGANAFLGVVNVVTRSPEETSGAAVGLGVGSRLASGKGKGDLARADFLVARHGDKTSFLASGAFQYQNRSGLRLPDPVPAKYQGQESARDLSRPASFFTKFAFGDFTLSGLYQRLDSYGEFTDFSVLTHQNRLVTENWFLKGEHRWQPAPKWDLRASLAVGSGMPGKEDHLDTGSATTWIKRELDVKSLDVAAEFTYFTGSGSSFLGGLDYTEDDHQPQNNILVRKDGSRESYATSLVLKRARIRNAGALLQAILPWKDRLTFTGGLRWDRNRTETAFPTGSGQEFSAFNWRAAFVLKLGARSSLKLMHGTSFKAPTSRELFDVSGSSRGNPELEPQKARTTELALEWVAGKAKGSLALFASEFRDLIALKGVSGIPGVTKQNANLGRQRSKGAEADAHLFVGSTKAYANVSFQRTEDKDTGLRVPLVPEWTANAGLGRDFGILSAFLEASYVGNRLSPKAATVVYATPLQDPAGFRVPAYTLLNLNLASRSFEIAGSRTEFSLLVRNLTDTSRVDPGYENQGIDVPHLGRSFLLRMTTRF